MTRIITLNLNGIRAAARKGFYDWLQTCQADIVCLQETKAQQDQLTDEIFHPRDYHCYYFDAEKKGYSGVAIYSKLKPKKVHYGLGFATADQEGRYIQVDFDKLSVASLYLPSGSSGDERQQVKFSFMDNFLQHLQALRKKQRDYIICGDWNTVHQRIDIKNFSGNQKNSGCLPEERQWMDNLFNKEQYTDAFRCVNQQAEQYTWWSNRGQAWANNVGWRIDYHIISNKLADTVKHAEIYKAQRFSDHAPLTIDYEIALSLRSSQ